MQGSVRRRAGRTRTAAIVLALLLPLAALAVAAPSEAAGRAGSGAVAATPKRATWVWTRPAAKTLVAWAVKQHVGELFLSVGPNLSASTDLTWVRSVATQAHANGIRVSALGGDPAWIDRPQDALAWQLSAVSTGLFDGVHVDVEPWVRSDWDTRRDQVVAGYLAVLGQLAGDTTLPVEADIAFWLHQLTSSTGVPLDEAVLRLVDAVTVMSYRNTATGPDSITDLGGHELATAARLGKPCRLAVETNYLGADAVSRKQTFWGLGITTLIRALGAVDAAEAGVSSYNGVAVEDYAGWRAL